MLEAIFGAVFVALILLGTLALAYAFMFRMLMPDDNSNYYIVIPSSFCCDDIATTAYSLRTKIQLMGDSKRAKVLVVDMGMDEAQKLSCLNICRNTNGIYLVKSQDVKDIINGKYTDG